MKYVVLIQIFHNLKISKTDEKWHIIKEENGITYKWRLFAKRYQLLSGEYADIEHAKTDANRLYVSTFYNFYDKLQNTSYCGSMGMMYKECYNDLLLSIKDSNSPIAIYEINEMSEIENMKMLSCKVFVKNDYYSYFDFNNLFSREFFDYSEESHPYLYALNLAFNVDDFGLKMTLLCGILERLAKDEYKSESVIKEINRLISLIDKTKLRDDDYEKLKNYMYGGKKKSSSQKCLGLIDKYAPNFEIKSYSAYEILKKAYSIRSSYSHGNNPGFDEKASYMSGLVLQIIKEYFKQQQEKNNNTLDSLLC